MRRDLTVGLLLLGGYALFNAGAALWTRMLHGSVPPASLLCVRALVWLCWLGPWAAWQRAGVRAGLSGWTAAAALLGTLSLFGYVQALTLIPLPLATTLLYGWISPFVLLLDWLICARRPSPGDILLLLGATGGMALIALPEGSYSTTDVSPVGVAAAVSCAFLMAVYLMAVQRAKAGPNVLNFFYATTLLICGLPSLVSQPTDWSSHTLGIAVLYGLFSLIAQSLVVMGSQRMGAAAAGASSCAIPIFATFLGWAALGESVSRLEVLALFLVVGCAGKVSLSIGSRNQGGPAPFRWSRLAPK